MLSIDGLNCVGRFFGATDLQVFITSDKDPVSDVPEPATFTLVAVCLVWLAMTRP